MRNDHIDYDLQFMTIEKNKEKILLTNYSEIKFIQEILECEGLEFLVVGQSSSLGEFS